MGRKRREEWGVFFLDKLSPSPGIRSGLVASRKSGASDEIWVTDMTLVFFSGCLWSSGLVSGNPFPPFGHDRRHEY